MNWAGRNDRYKKRTGRTAGDGSCQIGNGSVDLVQGTGDRQGDVSCERLISVRNNSQNTNFTKGYAGPVTMRLKGGVIRSAVKEGYKYRDVNGRILEEIPDRTLTKEEIAELPKLCEGQYLYDMQKLAEDNGIQTWVLGIECPQQEEFDTLVTDSWQIAVSFTEAVFTWEFYMNRVES